MPKIVSSIMYQVSGEKANKFKMSLNTKYIIHNTAQQGIAQILVLLLLVAGIGLGTYLVQQKTHILPFADCNPGIDNDCDSGGGSDQEQADQSENGGPKSDEQLAEEKQHEQDLEKGAREAGKTLDEYKVDDCKKNPGNPNCDQILKNDAAKQSAAAGADSGNGGDSSGKKTCSNTNRSVTSTNIRSENGQCWDGLSNEEQNAFIAKYCTPLGKVGRCNEAKEGWMAEADARCREEGTCAGNESNRPKTEEEIIAAQIRAGGESKAQIDANRKSVDPQEVFSAERDDINPDEPTQSNLYICIQAYGPDADCKTKVAVFRGLVTAQQAYDNANTSGLSGPSLIAKLDEAKLLGRSANCDAVAAGVKGANCVLDVGDRQNIITAKVNGQDVRLFVGRSTHETDDRGIPLLIFNYRDPACDDSVLNKSLKICQLKKLSYAEAKPFLNDDVTSTNADGTGLPNITSFNQIRPNFTSSIVNLCSDYRKGCITSAQASGTPPASSPSIAPASADRSTVSKGAWEGSNSCSPKCNEETSDCVKINGGSAVCKLRSTLESKRFGPENCNGQTPPRVCAAGRFCGADSQCHTRVTTSTQPAQPAAPDQAIKPLFVPTGN